MIDDATVFRLGRGQLPLHRRRRVRRRLAQGAGRAGSGCKVFVKPSTDQLHNLAVQGPESREIMKQLVWTPPTQPSLEELKWFRFLVGRFGGYDGIPVVVSRTGYTGELGYEIFCHPDDGPAVWDAIWEAGAGARPEAARARGARHDPHRGGADLRRLRVRRPGRPVRGRDRLRGQARLRGRLRRQGGARRALGPPAAHARRAWSSRATRPPGTATRSGTGAGAWGWSRAALARPTLRKNVALCRMSVQYAELGTDVEVGKLDGLQKRIAAKVVRFPFYDPDKTKPALVSEAPRPPEFDFPLSWTGPDGIGASPVRRVRRGRGARRSDDEGHDPAVALRRTLGMFATGRHRDHHAQGRAGARHDGQRVHVGVARAAARADLGRPADEDVRHAPRGRPLRGQRALRDASGPLGPLRRPPGRGTARRRASTLVRETPLVDGALAHFVARVERSYWGGDHSLFLGRVEYARTDSGTPLLFHGGRYERLGQSG